MEQIKPYWVFTPEYDEVIPVIDFGQGPIEPVRDIAAVLALDKEHAKVLAVKAFRKQRSYISKSDENPFIGLQVWEAICPHGTWEFTEVLENGTTKSLYDCDKCYQECIFEETGEL